MSVSRKNDIEQVIPSLEKQLQKTFQQEAPDPEFRARLKNRLVEPDQVYLERVSSKTGFLLILVGFLFGVAIFIMGKYAGDYLARGIREDKQTTKL